MLKIPSESEFKFVSRYQVGDKFFTSDLRNLYGVEAHELGGIVATLIRRGLIKALFYRGSAKNGTRNVCYERVA